MRDKTRLIVGCDASDGLGQLERKLEEVRLELVALRSAVTELIGNGHNSNSLLPTSPPEAQRQLAKLSPREREIVQRFAQLHTVKKIASALGTEPQTVRNQLASIRAKLEASSREEFWETVLKLRPWLENG